MLKRCAGPGLIFFSPVVNWEVGPTTSDLAVVHVFEVLQCLESQVSILLGAFLGKKSRDQVLTNLIYYILDDPPKGETALKIMSS